MQELITDEEQLSELDQIDGLLRGDVVETPEETADIEAVEADEVETLEESAEEPEKEEKEKLDYGMQVPMPDGEPVSLGELKDFYQQQSQHKLDMVERENVAMRKQEAAELLLSYVQDLPPHVAQAAQEQAAQDYTNGLSRLNDMIPDTKTADGMQRVKDNVYAIADEYGLGKQWADRIQDPVAIKMLNDYAALKATIKQAKSNVKPIKAKQPKQTAKPIKQSDLDAVISKAKATGHSHDQQAAIEMLFRS